MPRFAANLSMMFTEVPFIERFAAARKAGFDAVEFLFPYNYSTLQIQKQLEQNHLTLALFNTAPGDINAGEWGLSALPVVLFLRRLTPGDILNNADFSR